MANFFDLYRQWAGISRIPSAYHAWCARSLLAACAGDRVWIERTPGSGERTFPNLFIILVGPSGVQKGRAISKAVRLSEDLLRADLFSGRATAEALRDRLSRIRYRPDGSAIPPNPRVWLINPELANAVHPGEAAFQFISTLTNFWDSAGRTMQIDATRTRGEIIMQDVCINWLAATTPQWLTRTFPGGFLEGGPARRISFVLGVRPELAPLNDVLPPNAEELRLELRARCTSIFMLQGPCVLEPSAQAAMEAWFEGRPRSVDPEIEAWYESQDELIYKLAILQSLADRSDLVVTVQHIAEAQRVAQSLEGGTRAVLSSDASDRESIRLDRIRNWVRVATEMPHSGVGGLAQKSARFGITSRDLDVYVQTLVNSGEIERFMGGARGGVWYRWASGNGRPPLRVLRPLALDVEEGPS